MTVVYSWIFVVRDIDLDLRTSLTAQLHFDAAAILLLISDSMLLTDWMMLPRYLN